MNIKELRKKLGLSQGRLAAQIGVSPLTVLRWESGKTKPSPLALERLRNIEKEVAVEK